MMREGDESSCRAQGLAGAVERVPDPPTRRGQISGEHPLAETRQMYVCTPYSERREHLYRAIAVLQLIPGGVRDVTSARTGRLQSCKSFPVAFVTSPASMRLG